MYPVLGSPDGEEDFSLLCLLASVDNARHRWDRYYLGTRAAV